MFVNNGKYNFLILMKSIKLYTIMAFIKKKLLLGCTIEYTRLFFFSIRLKLSMIQTLIVLTSKKNWSQKDKE